MADVEAYLRELEDETDRPRRVRKFLPRRVVARKGGGGLATTVSLAAGQGNPVNAGPINFTVAFSKPVTGFTNADVSFAGSTVGGTLAAAVTGTGPSYNVAVTGMTGSGVVQISVPAGAAADAVTGAPTPASGAAYVTLSADTTRPSATITKAAGQADPADTGPINFTVVFNEVVTGFTSAGLGGPGTTAPGTPFTRTITGSGTTYNVAVSGMTGPGNVGLMVNSGAAQDAAGNTNTASSSVVVAYAPTAIGFPDASNTGVPVGTVLTPYVGPTLIVINGTLVENKLITDGIETNAANVVFRNCRIENASIHGINGGDGTNTTIEHCTIIGDGGAGVSTGILAGGTLTANDISGFALGFSLTGPSTVKDNYVHDLHKDAVDTHYDGLAVFGGGSALIEHNTFWVPTQAGGGATACIFLKNAFGQINNVTIRNNLLRGEPSYTFQFDGQTAGSTISNVSVINNVMQTGIFGYFSVDVPPAATNITGSGNTDYLTNAVIPFPNIP